MESETPRPRSGEVERTARIFQAGSYPDRGLTIGPGDLDAIAGAFSSPAPVLVEHLEGPLRLGWLKRVWREGPSLFGRLVFSRAAWELMRECGARALSLGLDRETLRIREVSLVSRPRVAGAQVFSERIVRAGEFQLDDEEETETLTEKASGTVRPAPAGETGRDAAGLRERLRLSEAQQELKRFIEEGKVSPGASAHALAILCSDSPKAVCFADGTRSSAAQAFRQFLEAQPPVVLFGETAPAGPAAPRHGVSRELLEAFGLSDDDIARYARMSREEWNGRTAG